MNNGLKLLEERYGKQESVNRNINTSNITVENKALSVPVILKENGLNKNNNLNKLEDRYVNNQKPFSIYKEETEYDFLKEIKNVLFNIKDLLKDSFDKLIENTTLKNEVDLSFFDMPKMKEEIKKNNLLTEVGLLYSGKKIIDLKNKYNEYNLENSKEKFLYGAGNLEYLKGLGNNSDPEIDKFTNIKNKAVGGITTAYNNIDANNAMFGIPGIMETYILAKTAKDMFKDSYISNHYLKGMSKEELLAKDKEKLNNLTEKKKIEGLNSFAKSLGISSDFLTVMRRNPKEVIQLSGSNIQIQTRNLIADSLVVLKEIYKNIRAQRRISGVKDEELDKKIEIKYTMSEQFDKLIYKFSELSPILGDMQKLTKSLISNTLNATTSLVSTPYKLLKLATGLITKPTGAIARTLYKLNKGYDPNDVVSEKEVRNSYFGEGLNAGDQAIVDLLISSDKHLFDIKYLSNEILNVSEELYEFMSSQKHVRNKQTDEDTKVYRIGYGVVSKKINEQLKAVDEDEIGRLVNKKLNTFKSGASKWLRMINTMDFSGLHEEKKLIDRIANSNQNLELARTLERREKTRNDENLESLFFNFKGRSKDRFNEWLGKGKNFRRDTINVEREKEIRDVLSGKKSYDEKLLSYKYLKDSKNELTKYGTNITDREYTSGTSPTSHFSSPTSSSSILSSARGLSYTGISSDLSVVLPKDHKMLLTVAGGDIDIQVRNLISDHLVVTKGIYRLLEKMSLSSSLPLSLSSTISTTAVGTSGSEHTILEKIKELIKKFGFYLSKTFSKFDMEKILTKFQKSTLKLIEKIKNNSSLLFESIKSNSKSIFKYLKDKSSTLYEKVKETGIKGFTNLKEKSITGFNTLSKFLSEKKKIIVPYLEDMFKKININIKLFSKNFLSFVNKITLDINKKLESIFINIKEYIDLYLNQGSTSPFVPPTSPSTTSHTSAFGRFGTGAGGTSVPANEESFSRAPIFAEKGTSSQGVLLKNTGDKNIVVAEKGAELVKTSPIKRFVNGGSDFIPENEATTRLVVKTNSDTLELFSDAFKLGIEKSKDLLKSIFSDSFSINDTKQRLDEMKKSKIEEEERKENDIMENDITSIRKLLEEIKINSDNKPVVKTEKEGGIFDSIKKMLLTGAMGIGGLLSGKLTDLLKGLGSLLFDAGKMIITSAFKNIGVVMKGFNIINIATGAFSLISDGITGFMSGYSEGGIVKGLESALSKMFSIGEGGMASAFNMSAKGAAIGAAIATVIPIPFVNWAIGGLVGSIVGGIIGWIGAERLGEWYKSLGGEYLNEIAKSAWDFITQPITILEHFADNLFKTFDGTISPFELIKSTVGEIWDFVVSPFKNVIAWFESESEFKENGTILDNVKSTIFTTLSLIMKPFKGIIQLTEFVFSGDLFDSFGVVIDDVKNSFSNFFSGIGNLFSPITDLFNFISSINVKQMIENIIMSAYDMVKNIPFAKTVIVNAASLAGFDIGKSLDERDMKMDLEKSRAIIGTSSNDAVAGKTYAKGNAYGYGRDDNAFLEYSKSLKEMSPDDVRKEIVKYTALANDNTSENNQENRIKLGIATQIGSEKIGYDGTRATGGPMIENDKYLVGEEGKELVINFEKIRNKFSEFKLWSDENLTFNNELLRDYAKQSNNEKNIGEFITNIKKIPISLENIHESLIKNPDLLNTDKGKMEEVKTILASVSKTLETNQEMMSNLIKNNIVPDKFSNLKNDILNIVSSIPGVVNDLYNDAKSNTITLVDKIKENQNISSITDYAGLKIKDGINGIATAGGEARAGMIALAHAIQEVTPSFKEFTDFNSKEYDNNSASMHSKGNAVDFEINDLSLSDSVINTVKGLFNKTSTVGDIIKDENSNKFHVTMDNENETSFLNNLPTIDYKENMNKALEMGGNLAGFLKDSAVDGFEYLSGNFNFEEMLRKMVRGADMGLQSLFNAISDVTGTDLDAKSKLRNDGNDVLYNLRNDDTFKNMFDSGMKLVGLNGPEVVNAEKGDFVIDANKTKEILGSYSVGGFIKEPGLNLVGEKGPELIRKINNDYEETENGNNEIIKNQVENKIDESKKLFEMFDILSENLNKPQQQIVQPPVEITNIEQRGLTPQNSGDPSVFDDVFDKFIKNSFNSLDLEILSKVYATGQMPFKF